nr:HK97-gp10 family putative phage morphogenesis protein [Brucella intermedia]
MAKQDNGMKSFNAAIDRLKKDVPPKVVKALVTSANELAATQRRFAETSRDTGALIDSITVTHPGEQTPPYSQPGGSRVAGENEVIISAGNSDVRYAHLVEYGTKSAEAQPFFWPALRLTRKRLQSRIDRVGRAATKDAWKGTQAGTDIEND